MSADISPLVSILIPTFNGADFVKSTIDSVLNQDYREWELIVMDDGSTDNTIEIVRQFDDSRIRIIDKLGNVGARENWNRGLKYINGKYYKLLPQDDLLTPGCLRMQVDILENNPTVVLVFAQRQVIDPAGKNLVIRGNLGKLDERLNAGELVRRCIRSGTNVIGEPGSGLVRKTDLLRVGLYSNKFPYVIDLDFWFRVLEGGDGYYLARPLSCFRVSIGAWSVKLGKNQVYDYVGLVRDIYDSSKFGLSTFDKWLGIARAYLNFYLRLIYYKLFL